MPCPEASAWMTVSAPGTTYASVTSLQMSAFVASNAESCEVFHSNSASFLERSLNVAVCADIFGVKGDMCVAIPKNSYSYVAFFGIFIGSIVCDSHGTLERSGGGYQGQRSSGAP